MRETLRRQFDTAWKVVDLATPRRARWPSTDLFASANAEGRVLHAALGA